jgi:alpha-tubulin suppressor-like RCC1 family protein
MGINGQACAARATGGVSCWAQRTDYWGASRREIAGITDAVAVSTSTYDPGFTCALRRTGTVACWGNGRYGELGTEARGERVAPADVRGVDSALAVGTGGDFACALLRSGGVRCWGRNHRGQLGDGTTTDRDTAVDVAGLSDAISITVGYEHACAERSSGAVVCWGANREGQVGNGTALEVVDPRIVPGIQDVVQVAAGVSHTCVRHTNGTVSCWGDVDSRAPEGEVDRMSPTAVAGINDAIDLAGGHSYTCVVHRGGHLSCFRKEAYGARPDRTSIEEEPVDRVARVFVGGSHECAQRSDGELLCAGYNPDGQLGVGSLDDKLQGWRTVPQGKGAIAVAASHSHTCIVRPNGTVGCWGHSYTDDPNHHLPGWTPAAAARPLSTIRDATAIASTFVHTCAINKSGGAFCWGEKPMTVPGLVDAIDVASGFWWSCATTRKGEAWCWHPSLALFNEAMENAQRVPGLSDVKAISMGWRHACALLGTGRVACWGDTDDGQLGIGRTVLQPRPVAVEGLP